MKYTPTSISPEQTQFLEIRKFQIDEITRIFRVPPHMVGDLEKSSFSNIEQHSLEFVKYTLDPWVCRWEQAMNRSLLNETEKKNYFVKFNMDGLAASAASVIAVAGNTVFVSPVSMMMVHNPATVAAGDHAKMEEAIAMLDEVNNSIINTYQTKTGLSRQKLSQLMKDETWMNARKAVEFHFADGIMEREQQTQEEHEQPEAMSFARYSFVRQVTNRHK